MIQNGPRLIEHVGDLSLFARWVGLPWEVRVVFMSEGKVTLTGMSIHDSLHQRSQAHFKGFWTIQGCLYGAKALHGLFRSRLDADRVELPLGRRCVAFA